MTGGKGRGPCGQGSQGGQRNRNRQGQGQATGAQPADTGSPD